MGADRAACPEEPAGRAATLAAGRADNPHALAAEGLIGESQIETLVNVLAAIIATACVNQPHMIGREPVTDAARDTLAARPGQRAGPVTL